MKSHKDRERKKMPTKIPSFIPFFLFFQIVLNTTSNTITTVLMYLPLSLRPTDTLTQNLLADGTNNRNTPRARRQCGRPQSDNKQP